MTGMEPKTNPKWKCPRCQRWVREQMMKVCSQCREEETAK